MLTKYFLQDLGYEGVTFWSVTYAPLVIIACFCRCPHQPGSFSSAVRAQTSVTTAHCTLHRCAVRWRHSRCCCHLWVSFWTKFCNFGFLQLYIQFSLFSTTTRSRFIYFGFRNYITSETQNITIWKYFLPLQRKAESVDRGVKCHIGNLQRTVAQLFIYQVATTKSPFCRCMLVYKAFQLLTFGHLYENGDLANYDRIMSDDLD